MPRCLCGCVPSLVRRGLLATGLAAAAFPARAQISADPALVDDIVTANRILYDQGVVDGFGHISARHDKDPGRYLLSRSMAPALVTAGDIMEFDLDSNPIDARGRAPYLERFIHGALYEARPDVNSVVHSHAEETLAFGITGTPLPPVIHLARAIGPTVPVWDIAEKFGDNTDLLVTNAEHGRDLAARLGQASVALMRGHGFAAVGAAIPDVVRLSVYLPVNARVLTTAMRFGEFKALAPGELSGRSGFDPGSASYWRAWEYWARRAGVGERLGEMP